MDTNQTIRKKRICELEVGDIFLCSLSVCPLLVLSINETRIIYIRIDYINDWRTKETVGRYSKQWVKIISEQDDLLKYYLKSFPTKTKKRSNESITG